MTDIRSDDEARQILSWAGHLVETHDDFRRTGGQYMKEWAEAYLDRPETVQKPAIGVHGRNAQWFDSIDYDVVERAKLQSIKMMSLTDPSVFATLKQRFPAIRLVTRLYDDRFNAGNATNEADYGYRVSPSTFADRMSPKIDTLRAFCNEFEVHNEPNHLAHYEGWGQTDEHARDFQRWFLETYRILKSRFPSVSFGYPGLAVPHNDFRWLDLNRQAIERADFLGCHCYWQTPSGQERNHLSDTWGLRFKVYHQKFPDKPIYITEAGNSNFQSGISLPDQKMATETVEWLTEVIKYPYIQATAFFILSSPDQTWSSFAWRLENGYIRPVVDAVGRMGHS
jgi:hypothetical protein